MKRGLSSRTRTQIGTSILLYQFTNTIFDHSNVLYSPNGLAWYYHPYFSTPKTLLCTNTIARNLKNSTLNHRPQRLISAMLARPKNAQSSPSRRTNIPRTWSSSRIAFCGTFGRRAKVHGTSAQWPMEYKMSVYLRSE